MKAAWTWHDRVRKDYRQAARCARKWQQAQAVYLGSRAERVIFCPEGGEWGQGRLLCLRAADITSPSLASVFWQRHLNRIPKDDPGLRRECLTRARSARQTREAIYPHAGVPDAV